MNKLKLYTASWCQACIALKNALNAEKIPYDLISLDTDMGLDEACKNHIKSIPAIIYNGIIHTNVDINYIKNIISNKEM